ncbi:MAG: hypothetical protein ACI4HJ_00915 [Ruminococcus sp.]|nr:hypothetical protein [Oscillospiraceae bacterium]
MKEYVSVTARFDSDGNLLPITLHWKDGRNFDIDRVLDIRYAASLKAGGAGIRYSCRIAGQNRYLFLEENRWFVDSK